MEVLSNFFNSISLSQTDLYLMAKHDPELLVAQLTFFILLCYTLSRLPPFQGLAFKLRCYAVGIVHFWATRENKIGNTDRVAFPNNPNIDVIEKEFIFIRHGESEWNEIFNRSKLFLLPRLIFGIARELLFLPFETKSVFLDSCLGPVGQQQAKELANAVKNSKNLDSLTKIDSVVLTSNLRRCVQTTLIGLEPRLVKTQEAVYVLSSLQEASPNIDTVAITPAHSRPSLEIVNEKLLDPTFNHGGKRWYERAVRRIQVFLRISFSRGERTIIVVGHSLYFKKFFKEFIDDRDAGSGVAFLARNKKLSNCGVVRFKVQQARDLPNAYRVVPSSIELLRGSWV